MQIRSHSPTPPSLHRFLIAARDPSSDNLYFSAANQTGRLLLADCAENPAPGCSQTPFNCCKAPLPSHRDNNQQSQCSVRSKRHRFLCWTMKYQNNDGNKLSGTTGQVNIEGFIFLLQLQLPSQAGGSSCSQLLAHVSSYSKVQLPVEFSLLWPLMSFLHLHSPPCTLNKLIPSFDIYIFMDFLPQPYRAGPMLCLIEGWFANNYFWYK